MLCSLSLWPESRYNGIDQDAVNDCLLHDCVSTNTDLMRVRWSECTWREIREEGKKREKRKESGVNELMMKKM